MRAFDFYFQGIEGFFCLFVYSYCKCFSFSLFLLFIELLNTLQNHNSCNWYSLLHLYDISLHVHRAFHNLTNWFFYLFNPSIIMMACHRIDRSNHWSLLSVFPNLIWKHGGYSYNSYWILIEFQQFLLTIRENAKLLATCQKSGPKASQSYRDIWGYLETNGYFTREVKQAAQTYSTFPHATHMTPPPPQPQALPLLFFSPSFLLAIFVKGGLEIKHVEMSSMCVRVENFYLGISR